MTAKRKAGGKAQRKAESNTLTIVGRNDTAGRQDEFLDGEIIKISDYLCERKVPTSTLKQNVSKFLARIGDIVAEAPSAFGAYELHEIELAAEITVSGELKIWGSGGRTSRERLGSSLLFTGLWLETYQEVEDRTLRQRQVEPKQST